MRPKRPTHVLIDHVRTTREGNDAIIDQADANLSGARIAGIATMTDANIVEMYNDILDSQWALLEAWDKAVVEELPGEKQIDYHENSDQWVRRGDVLRCIIHDGGPTGKSPSISTTRSCRSGSSASCSACMPDGECGSRSIPRNSSPRLRPSRFASLRSASASTERDAGNLCLSRFGDAAHLLLTAKVGDMPSVSCDFENMSDFLQLDLFGDRPDLDRPSKGASAKPIAPEGLSDGDLISAIPDATLGEASAMAAEAGKRRLSAAVPVLTSLCNRFVGYGAGVVVPEQIAALNALGAIGGQEATHAVSRLIAKKIVQGPTLITALTVASQLDVVLPSDVSVNLLRDPTSSVRAAACGCVRPGHEVVTMLVSMIDDSDDEVVIASACALGRMGRIEALGHLKRHLLQKPSRRIVEALARVADEEAIVFLARAGRARRELTEIVITALEEIESPRALDAAGALKKFSRRAGSHSQP